MAKIAEKLTKTVGKKFFIRFGTKKKMLKKDIRRRRTHSETKRRSCTLHYNLKIENKEVPECKKMFLNTFGLKEWSIRNWVLNVNIYNIPFKKKKHNIKIP